MLDVLEQPQLMDACVRNGFVDDALELEASVRAKAALHADVPLLDAIATQASSYMGGLQAQLLAQLSGPLMLPGALRCLGYLRRMGGPHALTEPQLRVAFLRGRTAHLAAAEAALARDSPVSYLLKYVELCRVHWYDATTQYRTLFASDEAPLTPAAARAPFAPRRSAPAPTYTRVLPRPADAPPGSLLTLSGDDGATHVVAVPPDAAAAGDPMSVLLVADSRWGGAPRDAAHALEPRALLHGEALGAALLADWATERLGELLAALELWMPRVQEGSINSSSSRH